MGALIAYLTVLTLACRQLSEELLGAYLSGIKMKLAAILVTIGVAFGLRQLALDVPSAQLPIPIYGVWATLIIGLMAGLGANFWHLLLDAFTRGSSSNDVTLTGTLKPTPPTPTPTPVPPAPAPTPPPVP